MSVCQLSASASHLWTLLFCIWTGRVHVDSPCLLSWEDAAVDENLVKLVDSDSEVEVYSGGNVISPRGINTLWWNWMFLVCGIGVIYSDRLVCQMRFSEKYTDWSLLRQILSLSFLGGQNNFNCCETELAKQKEHGHKLDFVPKMYTQLFIKNNKRGTLLKIVCWL